MLLVFEVGNIVIFAAIFTLTLIFLLQFYEVCASTFRRQNALRENQLLQTTFQRAIAACASSKTCLSY